MGRRVGRLRAALARAYTIDPGSAPVSLQAICLREAQDFAVEQSLEQAAELPHACGELLLHMSGQGLRVGLRGTLLGPGHCC